MALYTHRQEIDFLAHLSDAALTGELRRLEDAHLLETVPERLRATVIKAGHHGSNTSTSAAFLAAVRPKVVVISSGVRAYNGEFLPTEQTLKRLCCLSPRPSIYRTDYEDREEGRTTKTDQDADHVVIRTNGKQLRVTQYSSGVEVGEWACDMECDE